MGIRGFRHSGMFLLMVLAGVLHAQSPTSSSSSKPRSEQSRISAPDPGSIANGLYHNSFFGFDYKLHFGWVDRTTEMREDSSEDSNDPKKSILLLAAFEHPPEVAGDSVNSAVVVAAEAASSYPGLQNARTVFRPSHRANEVQGLYCCQRALRIPRRNGTTGSRGLQQTARQSDHAPKHAGHDREGFCGLVYVYCAGAKTKWTS